MKSAKLSILAGAAALLSAVNGASAADLPMGKAEAVEYVKVCTEYGSGFFYIPGSDTCLQISGQLRAEYFYVEPTTRESDATRFRTQARVRWDARTASDWGTVRTFIEFQAQVDPGGSSAFSVRRAFIQFAGLTAGYAWSPFSFYDQYYNAPFFAPVFGENGRRNLLSYTATFGKAWAALSIEDAKAHRASGSFGTTDAVAPLATLAYGGQIMPDIVAAIGYDDNKNGWGRVQVMGAIHQNRTVNPNYDSEIGYAVGFGGNVNLPVAEGAYIAVEAVYANGALKYLNAGAADAFGTDPALALPYQFDTAKGWSIQAEAGVNVTKQVKLVAFGGYLDYDAPSIAPNNFASTADFTSYTVGGQAVYTIVKNGLLVGGEVYYTNKNFDGPLKTVDSFGGGVRIQSNF